MLQKLLLLTAFFTASLVVTSQNTSIIIIDKETQKPVPFATIQFSINDGIMSNEEGMFTIPENTYKKTSDSIVISCMGYEKLSIVKEHISNIDTIRLKAKIFEIAPIVLSSKKLPVDQIIKKIKENIGNNYVTSDVKFNVFLRENYYQKQIKWIFNVEKSSIKEINQHTIDTIFEKMPKEYRLVNESYSKLYLGSDDNSKTQIEKMMRIRSKHQKFSIDNLQNDFYNALQRNMKGNSYLVIKTGIIRLDKTEAIDSILTEMKDGQEKEIEDYAEAIQKGKNKAFKGFLDKLFIHSKSKQDFIHKSYKYDYELIKFSEINNDLVYVIGFKPKNKAKYKGRLYIDTETFAVVRADVEGAHKVFDNQFNMFGIHSSILSVKKTILFEKGDNGDYLIKYYKSYSSHLQGAKRDFKIIEKNKIVKGRNKQNQLNLEIDIKTYSDSKWEMVFTYPQKITNIEFENFNVNKDFTIKEFTSYPKYFWNGYNILTPEKAVQELIIED